MSGKQSMGVHMALLWIKRNPGGRAADAARYGGVSVKSVNRALHAAGRSAEVRPVGRPKKDVTVSDSACVSANGAL